MCHYAPLRLCASAVSNFKLNRIETVRGGFSDALEHFLPCHHLRLLLVFMPPHLAALDLATLVRHRRALTNVAIQLLQRPDSREHHVVLCSAKMTNVPDVSLFTPRFHAIQQSVSASVPCSWATTPWSSLVLRDQAKRVSPEQKACLPQRRWT